MRTRYGTQHVGFSLGFRFQWVWLVSLWEIFFFFIKKKTNTFFLTRWLKHHDPDELNSVSIKGTIKRLRTTLNIPTYDFMFIETIKISNYNSWCILSFITISYITYITYYINYKNGIFLSIHPWYSIHNI